MYSRLAVALCVQSVTHLCADQAHLNTEAQSLLLPFMFVQDQNMNFMENAAYAPFASFHLSRFQKSKDLKDERSSDSHEHCRNCGLVKRVRKKFIGKP